MQKNHMRWVGFISNHFVKWYKAMENGETTDIKSIKICEVNGVYFNSQTPPTSCDFFAFFYNGIFVLIEVHIQSNMLIFPCPIIENFIWIEPLLRGHLYYKATLSLSFLIQIWLYFPFMFKTNMFHITLALRRFKLSLIAKHCPEMRDEWETSLSFKKHL
jgi:hypothetical protein